MTELISRTLVALQIVDVTVEYYALEMKFRAMLLSGSGIPSFLGMGEVDPDVWHLKYRSTEAAM